MSPHQLRPYHRTERAQIILEPRSPVIFDFCFIYFLVPYTSGGSFLPGWPSTVESISLSLSLLLLSSSAAQQFMGGASLALRLQREVLFRARGTTSYSSQCYFSRFLPSCVAADEIYAAAAAALLRERRLQTGFRDPFLRGLWSSRTHAHTRGKYACGEVRENSG